MAYAWPSLGDLGGLGGGPAEVVGAEVGVALGDRDVGVPEEGADLLDAPRPAPGAHHEVTRAGVPQIVEPHATGDARQRLVPRLDHPLGDAPVAPPGLVALATPQARDGGEHEPLLALGALILPLPQSVTGGREQGDVTDLAGLGRPPV